jgi:hypothetical protein
MAERKYAEEARARELTVAVVMIPSLNVSAQGRMGTVQSPQNDFLSQRQAVSNFAKIMFSLFIRIEQIKNCKFMDVLSKLPDIGDLAFCLCSTKNDIIDASVHHLVPKLVHVLYEVEDIGRLHSPLLIGKSRLYSYRP